MNPPPAIARRLLRYELFHLCAAAKVTHKDMGDRLSVSRASFSQLLSGKNLPSRPAVEIIAHHLGAPHRIPYLLQLLTLARQSRHADNRPGRHDRELAIGLEAFARTITVFDPTAITPLLQTTAYARDLLTAHATATPGLDVIEELHDLADRQQVITTDDNPAEFTWITEEQALHPRLSDTTVMTEQFQRLLAMTTRPNITIHIIPTATPAAPTSAFQLTHSPDGRVVAHQETRQATHYHDTPDAIADYTSLINHLRRHALDPQQSRDLITHLDPRRPSSGPDRVRPTSEK